MFAILLLDVYKNLQANSFGIKDFFVGRFYIASSDNKFRIRTIQISFLCIFWKLVLLKGICLSKISSLLIKNMLTISSYRFNKKDSIWPFTVLKCFTSSLFSLISLTNGCLNLLVISKSQVMVSLIFSVIHLFPISLISSIFIF